MYAVVDQGGNQYKVELGEEILVDRMDETEGELVELPRVLMVGEEEDSAPRIGQPEVEGARVLAEILAHERGPKVTTVRYKGPSQTKIGHRQDLTRLKILEIHPQ